jgi:tetratricopeptide (TPR) repeat protein
MFWRSRPPQKSMRRVHDAVRALEKNRTGIALQQLQEAHLLDPTNNDALYWLGLLLSRQDRQAEAAEALSLVAERVPGLPEVESALVDAYVATDEPESAVYHAQRLLEAAPYAPDTPLKLSIAHEAAGRLDLAIDALHQAPLHKHVLTDTLMQIHYRLGTLCESQGDPTQALHHFNRVYARDPAYRDVRSRVETLEAGQDH